MIPGTIRVGGVTDTLKQLVEHYNQSIHVVLDDVSDHGDETSNTSRPLHPPPPYFDPLMGRPPELSPIVRFWLDRLSIVSTTPASDVTEATCITEWIRGYESSIRPQLLDSSVGCIPILQEYELILSQWLDRIARQRSMEVSLATGGVEPDPSMDRRVTSFPSIVASPRISLPQLSRSIEILATDITLMTSERLFPTFSKYVRSNIILPTLLRILDRALEALIVLPPVQFGSTSTLEVSASVDIHRSCLRRCVVSLLAFEEPHIAPCDVAPGLAGGLGRGGIGSLCYYPPPDWKDEEVEQLNNTFLSFDSIDWSPVTLSAAVWNDPDTGIAARAARCVWSQLGCLLLGDHNETRVNHDDDGNAQDAAGATLVRRQAIVRVLGRGELLKDVGSHFFGRDMTSWEPPMHTSQQVVLGRRVAMSHPIVAEKPFQAVPARVVVAMNFFRLLLHSDSNTACSSRDFTENLFPICSTLLDSTSATLVALGASGMLQLLELLDETLRIFHDDSGEGGAMDSNWKSFVDDALSVLERAFKGNIEGPVVFAVGQAQSRLLGNLQLRNDSRWDTRRRKITGQWLFRLQRSSHSPASQSLCWELLVAGVAPLLLQHASTERTAADSMEMGRVGLSALLPLIQGEFVDDKTQVISVVALVNLLFGAYPIMPHHGGKIVSHLLASVAAITDETKDDSIRRKLTVHAAAVAVVICGPNFTGDVLDSISNNGEHYQDNLVEAALQVREQAAILQHRYAERV